MRCFAVGETLEWLLVTVCLVLGVIGFVFGARRRYSGESQRRWEEQERRLENEEDMTDRGPL